MQQLYGFWESNFRMGCFTYRGIFLPKLFVKYIKVYNKTSHFKAYIWIMDDSEKNQINPFKCKQHLKCSFSIFCLCSNPSSVFSLKQFQTPVLLLLILGAYQVMILVLLPCLAEAWKICHPLLSDGKWCTEIRRAHVSQTPSQGKCLGSPVQRSRWVWTIAVAFLSGSRAYLMAFDAVEGKFSCISHSSACSCKGCWTT